MLYQIVSYLLDVVCGLITGACLLRLYMQLNRVPFGNQIGQLVFALSNWLVLPLRRLIASVRGVDLASVLAALLMQLLQYGILWAMASGLVSIGWWFWAAFFGLLRVGVGALMLLLIVHAVLSWVQTRSAMADVLDRLAAPVLRPVRRMVPLVGGVDLSPLVLIVLLQVLLMVLGHVQMSVWR